MSKEVYNTVGAITVLGENTQLRPLESPEPSSSAANPSATSASSSSSFSSSSSSSSSSSPSLFSSVKSLFSSSSSSSSSSAPPPYLSTTPRLYLIASLHLSGFGYGGRSHISAIVQWRVNTHLNTTHPLRVMYFYAHLAPSLLLVPRHFVHLDWPVVTEMSYKEMKTRPEEEKKNAKDNQTTEEGESSKSETKNKRELTRTKFEKLPIPGSSSSSSSAPRNQAGVFRLRTVHRSNHGDGSPPPNEQTLAPFRKYNMGVRTQQELFVREVHTHCDILWKCEHARSHDTQTRSQSKSKQQQQQQQQQQEVSKKKIVVTLTERSFRRRDVEEREPTTTTDAKGRPSTLHTGVVFLCLIVCCVCLCEYVFVFVHAFP